MMFLKLLFSASAFYFVQARPGGEENVSVDQSVPTNDNTMTLVDPIYSKEVFEKFINEITKDIDKYFAPAISHLNNGEQVQLKDMCYNGIAGYVNWLFFVAQSTKEQGTGNYYNDSRSNILDDDDILVEFKSSGQLSAGSPFIPVQSHKYDENYI